MFPPEPACMSEEELASWRAMAVTVARGALDACYDCPLAFSSEMRAQGRCNGIPGLGRRATRAAQPSRENDRLRRQHYRRLCRDRGIDEAHAERVA